jgi:hypothetical protein
MIGAFVMVALVITVSVGVTITLNIPSAYSQGTPTCEDLEETNTHDKFYCREYQSEDGDTRTVLGCGDDKGDDFKCNKVIKDGQGQNINPATRDQCEMSSGGEKCKQIK